MGCLERGELRAFLDGEMAENELARTESHLASCRSCQGELEALRENSTFARSALDRVAPEASEIPHPARGLVRDRAVGKFGRPVTFGWGLSQMFRNLLGFAGGSRWRVAASTFAALLIVAMVSTLSPVQTLASSFLSIFRVQKFVAVQVDPTTLPKMVPPKDLGSFTTTGDGSMRVVTPQEAEKIVGFKLPVVGTLPQPLQSSPVAVMVSGNTSMTFTPDLKKVRAYLSSIGASNVKLPDSLDGAPITMRIPPRALELYVEKGSVSRNAHGMPIPSTGQQFLYLGVAGSPTLNVPDGVDVDELRAEVLKMPGLPADLVSQLNAISDWRNTAVVPVVKGTSHQVTVQGQQGVAISQGDGEGTTVMWPKDGKVYALSGSFTEAELLSIANSIQ